MLYRGFTVYITNYEPKFSGKQPGPVERSIHNFVKLSFKEGYDGSFIASLNETIQQKRWEATPMSILPAAPPQVGTHTKYYTHYSLC
jgi:hypothetical protein